MESAVFEIDKTTKGGQELYDSKDDAKRIIKLVRTGFHADLFK